MFVDIWLSKGNRCWIMHWLWMGRISSVWNRVEWQWRIPAVSFRVHSAGSPRHSRWKRERKDIFRTVLTRELIDTTGDNGRTRSTISPIKSQPKSERNFSSGMNCKRTRYASNSFLRQSKKQKHCRCSICWKRKRNIASLMSPFSGKVVWNFGTISCRWTESIRLLKPAQSPALAIGSSQLIISRKRQSDSCQLEDICAENDTV